MSRRSDRLVVLPPPATIFIYLSQNKRSARTRSYPPESIRYPVASILLLYSYRLRACVHNAAGDDDEIEDEVEDERRFFFERLIQRIYRFDVSHQPKAAS